MELSPIGLIFQRAKFSSHGDSAFAAKSGLYPVRLANCPLPDKTKTGVTPPSSVTYACRSHATKRHMVASNVVSHVFLFFGLHTLILAFLVLNCVSARSSADYSLAEQIVVARKHHNECGPRDHERDHGGQYEIDPISSFFQPSEAAGRNMMQD